MDSGVKASADRGDPRPLLIDRVENLIVPQLPVEQAERIRVFCHHFLQRSRPTDKTSTGPVRQTARLVGDKWTTLVVMVLHFGAIRYALLHRFVSLLSLEGGEHGISQRMLTLVLHNLELNGLVSSSPRSGNSARVEYSLTPLGESLHTQMMNLIEWAEQHTDEINQARSLGVRTRQRAAG